MKNVVKNSCDFCDFTVFAQDVLKPLHRLFVGETVYFKVFMSIIIINYFWIILSIIQDDYLYGKPENVKDFDGCL